jgi:radical SAM protein with 4Fe4S-binding SPASM domain
MNSSLEKFSFCLSDNLWIVYLDQLPAFNKMSQDKAGLVKIFDGHRITEMDSFAVKFIEFFKRARSYREIREHYIQMKTSADPELFFDRLLRHLLLRKIIRKANSSEKKNAFSEFRPISYEDCVFLMPDSLTFIDEGNWERTPFLILNPRAGRTHYMERHEYEVARYIQSAPRSLVDIERYYAEGVVKWIGAEDELDSLTADILPKLLLDGLLIPLPCNNKAVSHLQVSRGKKAKPNLFVHHPTINSYRIQPRGFPNSVALIPTNRCNNRCRHCLAYDDEKNYKDILSYSCLCRLIDEMHYNGLELLRFTGGEPFMREDILDILDYASTKNFGLMLYTNGNTITNENIDRIAAIQDRKEGYFIIHLSLDGDRRGHDMFRRTHGAFDRVMNTMRLFVEYNIQYYIEMIIHPDMLEGKRLEDIAEKVISLNSRALLTHPALAIGRGKDHADQICLDCEQVKVAWWKIHHLQEKYKGYDLRFKHYELPSAVYNGGKISSDIVRGKKEVREEQRSIVRSSGGQCTAGFRQMTIAHDGNVYPCPSWVTSGSLPMGNILSDSIAGVWRNSEKWSMTRGGWDYNQIEMCKECSHLRRCELGKLCRIPSLTWFGTPYGPPPSCVQYWKDVGLSPNVVQDFLENVRVNTKDDFPIEEVLSEINGLTNNIV